MLKKFQKESSISNLRCDNEYNEENEIKQCQNSLLNAIGPLNVKRWNALKNVLDCTDDIDFAAKLLDAGEEYYNRKIVKKGQKLNNVKRDVRRNKNKNKNDHLTKSIHDTKENVSKKEKNNCTIEENNLLDVDSTFMNQINFGENKTYTPSVTPSDTNLKKYRSAVIDEKNVCQNETSTNHIKEGKPVELDIEKAPEVNKKYSKIGKENDKSCNNLDISKLSTCQSCSTCHLKEQCPINYPHYIIKDSVDYDGWSDKFKSTYDNQQKSETQNDKDATDLKEVGKYSYALLSIPNFLDFGDTNTEHGLGVFAKSNIEPFSQFGPLKGKVVKEVDIAEDFSMKDLWEICSEGGNIYFNTEDVELSNWLKYVRPAPKREERNLTVISREKDLFFVSIKFIKSGEELLYWQDSPLPTSKKKMEKTSM